MTRTVVVDNDPLFRRAVCELIESSGSYRVVADAGSGRDERVGHGPRTHLCQLEPVFRRFE